MTVGDERCGGQETLPVTSPRHHPRADPPARLRHPRAVMGPHGPDPTRERAPEGWETGPMPVLDPNPQNGQKKMLLVFGAFLLIFVIIGVIASIASP